MAHFSKSDLSSHVEREMYKSEDPATVSFFPDSLIIEFEKNGIDRYRNLFLEKSEIADLVSGMFNALPAQDQQGLVLKFVSKFATGDQISLMQQLLEKFGNSLA